jgi:hypothetical protein
MGMHVLIQSEKLILRKLAARIVRVPRSPDGSGKVKHAPGYGCVTDVMQFVDVLEEFFLEMYTANREATPSLSARISTAEEWPSTNGHA